MTMEHLIVIVGCLGAWLLVAGPIYQAAIELREEEFDRDQLMVTAANLPQPERMSAWWWLLPPVAYLRQRAIRGRYRDAMLEALPPEQLEQAIAFMNKATGWLIVALGAFFIAIKETWELVELYEWPIAIFWVLVVLMPVLCVTFATGQLLRTSRALKKDEAASSARRGRPRAN